MITLRDWLLLDVALWEWRQRVIARHQLSSRESALLGYRHAAVLNGARCG